ncbi:ABC transporter ATP-binding protein [Cutibacterium sp. WCA-380-WT-3A]|uniref:ABC transporter ATP-binding protein n=1 Tax=Cutibacterium porci TaxID=2605781 RepID=A0A7K0J6X0_9ACTN|nr:ABC transporter ATP-binding protein [Cutibacterium porci]MSS45583.1 ABC transporter ATP-binding protein [Cutibacterium porci]
MIDLDSVTFTRPDGARRVTALDNVSIHVDNGHVAVITGPSGSGKSSLLAVASTLARPDSGTIYIDDTEVTGLDDASATQLRRERIGIVFQQSNLIASLDARDQLVMMGELDGAHRSTRARRRTQAEELLDAVGLADHMHKRPAQLSGGQRQRVNIARALMNEPTVLVVDEPTSALDSQAAAHITDMVVKLTHEHNAATILVTHDENLIARGSQHLHMLDGRLTPARR